MSETILLIESDPDLRKVITLSLRQEGFDILEVGDVAQAYGFMLDEPPEILILELDFPDGTNGALIEAYRRISDRDPANGKVVLTTTLRPGDAWRQKYQPDAVIYKPFDVRQLCDLIKDQVKSDSAQAI
jgi:DNA-binding response OmpR family regulator